MKNTFIYFLGTLTCLMSLLLSACSEDDATGAPYLKISKEELVFGKHEGEALLYIQSNAAYKVNAERKSKVDDNTAKMQSIKWLGV